MIRILLVDDQKMIREALRTWLEPELDLQIIGVADNGLSAVEQVEKLQPDVVLMNMEMPGLDGVSATKFINSKFDETKVIILSSFDTDDYIAKSLSVGAKGYLLKNTDSQDIVNAIRSVNKGYTQLGPGLLDKVLINTDSGMIISKLTSAPRSDSQNVSKSSLMRDKQLIARSKKAILTLQSTVDQQKEELSSLQDDFNSFRAQTSSVKEKISRHSKLSWLSLFLLVATLPLIFFSLFGLNSRAKTLEANSFPIERIGLNREYDLNGLAQRVEKTFRQDRMLAEKVSTIFVAQQEGIIYLKGSISDSSLLKRLEEMAFAVKGVKSVNVDKVEVLSPSNADRSRMELSNK